jgi:sterol desaturase/sphingolipid hydroxylase (fatty acid hydroxylase superfamily)
MLMLILPVLALPMLARWMIILLMLILPMLALLMHTQGIIALLMLILSTLALLIQHSLYDSPAGNMDFDYSPAGNML